MRAFETRDQKSDRCDVETVYEFKGTIGSQCAPEAVSGSHVTLPFSSE